MVQLSHPYMTTGKTAALTRRTFVDKVMSLLFNMLSRLVITFLPRSKHLLISWLQSPSAVILEPPKIKSATVSPSISHEVMGPDAMILVFWMLSFKLMINYAKNGYPIISKLKIWLHFIMLVFSKSKHMLGSKQSVVKHRRDTKKWPGIFLNVFICGIKTQRL